MFIAINIYLLGPARPEASKCKGIDFFMMRHKLLKNLIFVVLSLNICEFSAYAKKDIEKVDPVPVEIKIDDEENTSVGTKKNEIVESKKIEINKSESSEENTTNFKPAEIKKLYLGLESHYFWYTEPNVMSMYGPLSGGDFLYRPNIKGPLNLNLEWSIVFGIIQYDGQLSDGTPVKAGAFDGESNLRLMSEYQVYTEGVSNFYLDLGLGYRYLYDRVDSNRAYTREIAYFYFPVGARSEFKIKDYNFGVGFDYDFLWYGKAKSHLSEVTSGYPDATNTQKNGNGLRVYLESYLQFKSYSLLVRPYYQWWYVDNSDQVVIAPKVTLYEPQNNSRILGLQILLGL